MTQTGTLYIVATPIGNLGDITQRALDTLAEVDVIAAEDTRHSKQLLQHFNITTPLTSLHEHNEREKVPNLLKRLEEGNNIALISDAGTPLISDPGFHLVQQVQAAGYKVVPIPGACAAIAALSVAGLPSDRFIFEGFLPAKTKQRQDRLHQLAAETRTLIFYESPHRIIDSISDMLEVLGSDRHAVIARELTKTFETIQSGTLEILKKWILADKNQQKGEFVVLLQGVTVVKQEELAPEVLQTLEILLEELPLKQAVKLAEKLTSVAKNQLYKIALELKK